ncbi:chorismate mutase [Micromonospora sp. IBHARD004]|uniref:chorismate mutase n=1 Tax=Micromonospora sp. IBHARD004 TaxID=3457764 RepID=UPI00405931E2
MMTDVAEQSGGLARDHDRADPGPTAAATARTGTDDSAAAERIVEIRERIDEIDRTIIALWQERAALSQEVGATRLASGGTRLVLSREREILERFRQALGADGTQLALLLLRAGRGPL